MRLMITICFWRQSKALVTSEGRTDREPLLTRQPAEQNVCSAQRNGRSGSKAPTSLPGRGSTHLLGQSYEAAGAQGGGHISRWTKIKCRQAGKGQGQSLNQINLETSIGYQETWCISSPPSNAPP